MSVCSEVNLAFACGNESLSASHKESSMTKTSDIYCQVRGMPLWLLHRNLRGCVKLPPEGCPNCYTKLHKNEINWRHSYAFEQLKNTYNNIRLLLTGN